MILFLNYFNMNSTFRKTIIIAAVAVTSFLSFGFVESYFELSKNLDIFSTVYREINVKYVEETNPGKLLKPELTLCLGH